jgi:hypothetical protein
VTERVGACPSVKPVGIGELASPDLNMLKLCLRGTTTLIWNAKSLPKALEWRLAASGAVNLTRDITGIVGGEKHVYRGLLDRLCRSLE